MASRETGQLLVKLERQLAEEEMNASQARELVDEIENIIDDFIASGSEEDELPRSRSDESSNDQEDEE